jgi:hypothetical protein
MAASAGHQVAQLENLQTNETRGLDNWQEVTVGGPLGSEQVAKEGEHGSQVCVPPSPRTIHT